MLFRKCFVSPPGKARISVQAKPRLLALLATLVFLFVCTPLAYGTGDHTIAIDGANDFAGDEAVPGTGGSTWYFTWDANNFYFALDAPEVGSGSATSSIVLYLDTDPRQSPLSGNGSAAGRGYGTQEPALPFRGDYHLRWRADNTLTEMLAWNGSIWGATNNSGVAAGLNGGFVEFSIPRANLGSPGAVQVCGAMLVESGANGTFFLTPSSNGPEGFDKDFGHFFGFAMADGVSPNFAGNEDTYPAASVASGNFNSGATWTGGVAPHDNSNLFILDGHAVTLDADGETRHLAILAGGSFNGGNNTLSISDGGVLRNNGTFDAGAGTVFFAGAGAIAGSFSFHNVMIAGSVDFGTGAPDASVAGNLTIASSGGLNSVSGVLTLGGDFINDGVFDHNGGNFTFGGDGARTVSGSAATAFNTVTVNMSNSASIVEVLSPMSMATNGLTLTQGTFKLSSASTITPFGSSETIPAGAGFHLNNAAAVSNWGGTGTMTLNGALTVDSGTMHVGSNSGNQLNLNVATSHATVNGGTLNVAGRLNVTSSGVGNGLTVTGGEIVVTTVGNSNATSANFNIAATGGFAMTGGTLTFERANANASGNEIVIASGSGDKSITGGTIQIGNATTPADQIISINCAIPIFNLAVNSANATAQLLANSLEVDGDIAINAGAFDANNLNLTLAGHWTNYGTFIPGTGTVTLDGTSPQTMSGSAFNNLTIDNATGVALLTDQTVNGTLTLSNGTISTGSHRLIIAPSGTVVRGNGYVDGNLQKHFAAGADVVQPFEIGTGSDYTPVELAIASVTSAGEVVAHTLVGDHPNISSSQLNAAQSVNRHWTLMAEGGLTFTSYDANFAFAASDLDGGVNTDELIVGKFDDSGWAYPAVGARTATSTRATGLSSFGDFQLAATKDAAAPTANAGADQSMCAGKSVVIGGNPTASGGAAPYIYSWSPPGGLSSTTVANPTASPSSTTAYTVTITDANNQTATDQVTVTVNPLPVVTFNPVGPLCLNDPPVDLSGFVSPANGIFSGPGVTGTIFSPATAGLGAHTVTYTFTDNNGCTNNASRNIVVETQPTVTFNAVGPFCVNSPIFDLSAAVSPTGGTFAGPGVSGNSFDPAAAGIGTHTLTYTFATGSGCTNIASRDVVVSAPPAVTFDAVGPFCANAAPVDLSGFVSPAGGSFSGPGVVGNEFDPVAAGAGRHLVSYTVLIGACEGRATQTITVNDVPTADAGSDLTVSSGQTVPIGGNPTASGGTGPYTFIWSPAEGLDDPTAENPNATVFSTTTFAVTVTDAQGCAASDEVIVSVEAHEEHELVLIAQEYVEIARNKRNCSQGGIHSNGAIHFKRGDRSKFTGDLTAVGDITIEKENTIVGDATAGGSITLAHSARITGAKNEHAAVEVVPITAPSFSAGGKNHSVSRGRSLNLEPGSYGKVSVGEKATLRLRHGEYYFDQLQAKKEAKLSFEVVDGAIAVNVVNSLRIGKEVTVRISPGGEQNSEQVVFTTLQSAHFTLEEEAYVLGAINAPHAEVVIEEQVYFRGVLSARRIEVERDATFLHHSSSGRFAKPVTVEQEQESLTAGVSDYALEQNYPNPFNPTTVIRFQLPRRGEVELRLYNTAGQLVRTLLAREMAAGRHEITWDAKDERDVLVASGVYVCVLKAGDFLARRKMLLIK